MIGMTRRSSMKLSRSSQASSSSVVAAARMGNGLVMHRILQQKSNLPHCHAGPMGQEACTPAASVHDSRTRVKRGRTVEAAWGQGARAGDTGQVACPTKARIRRRTLRPTGVKSVLQHPESVLQRPEAGLLTRVPDAFPGRPRTPAMEIWQ